MKILLINKYYYLKGGSETYFFGLKNLLEKNGHQVIVFCMDDPKNEDSIYKNYFVKNIDFESKNIFLKIRNGINLIHSFETYHKLIQLIKDTNPDIAHVHIAYHQLTPIVFHVLNRFRIPTVLTTHDYKAICPNYIISHRGVTCKKCYNAKYYNCLINRCFKNSFFQSVLITIEAYYHKLRKSYTYIDKFVCPSKFIASQFIEAGIPCEKIIHIPNFLSDEIETNVDLISQKKVQQILFFGRLSHEKGVDILLDAKKILPDDYQLKIIGIGPDEDKLKKRVILENIKNVEFVGYKRGRDLFKEIQKSKITIVPSIWEEVFGLCVIESFFLGTPVIGANIGGISEIIQDKKTGFLFSSQDLNDLAAKIKDLMMMTPQDYNLLVNNCINESKKYSANVFYQKIIDLYLQICSNKK